MTVSKQDQEYLEKVRDIAARIDSLRDQADSYAHSIKDKRLRALAKCIADGGSEDMELDELDAEDIDFWADQ